MARNGWKLFPTFLGVNIELLGLNGCLIRVNFGENDFLGIRYYELALTFSYRHMFGVKDFYKIL